MKNANVIAICNQKGGVGKTATAISMSIGLVQEGKKVLLVDFDPQGDSTYALGWHDYDTFQNTAASLMKKVINGDEIAEKEAILQHKEGIDVVPANLDLADMELLLVTTMSREHVLKDYLDEVKGQYDYVIIDCPPSLSMLTINALAIADSVIIPVEAQPLPAKAMTQLFRTMNKVKRSLNPKLRIEGILITFADYRNNLTKDVVAQIRRDFGARVKVFESEIPTAVNASRATATGKSIFAYDENGTVANAYRALVKEVIVDGKKREDRNKSADIR